MTYVIQKEWLLKNLHDPTIRIVDCRFSLAESEKGCREYGVSHIPGAVFFDLEKDLSGAVSEHGGRHPLPNLTDFITKLELAGINEHVTVIAYDNGEGAFAARFWWMLQYLGHEKVYVLDGGFKAWNETKYPVTEEVPELKKTEFIAHIKPEILANVEDVRAVVDGQDNETVLIDSREEKRYLGLEEPIDKKAGRIPSAINKPWFEGLTDGSYKSAEEQNKRFSDVSSEKTVIVYCGSGVTAVPNYIALKEAGFEKVKLYLGSFSDWISFKENKIE